jgi:hypothetical protein
MIKGNTPGIIFESHIPKDIPAILIRKQMKLINKFEPKLIRISLIPYEIPTPKLSTLDATAKAKMINQDNEDLFHFFTLY